jgi:hypothetical protein
MTHPLPTVGADAETWGTKLNEYLTLATFGPVLNIKDYGAVGDGSTDDTTAIQNALNASTLAAPRTIYIPTGTYKITASLVIPYAPYTSPRI